MVLNFITWNLNPVAFAIGSLEVRWYGILWALGFLLGYLVMDKIYKKERMPEGSLDSLLIYMLVSTVVGARLGHCLFYEPNYYLSRPLEMLKIWEGGLASHGGAIGILIGLLLYVRRFNKSTNKKKGDKTHITYLWILDRVVIPVCLVGALIRVGNVCNHEIYGTPTSLPWGFVFLRGQEQFCGTFDQYVECTSQSCCPPEKWLPCHPTGLYEALFCLLTMGLLLYLYYKKEAGDRHPGLLFGLFLVIIFTSRILIEFLKNVQVSFETNMTLDMGQWLSIPFVLTGIVMIIRAYKKRGA